jgi:type II protein arginine methyltransferase
MLSLLSSLCIQESLYLPSKSELQVSIWRLTNQRQVWYEWYAEAFLSLPYTSPLVSAADSPKPDRTSLKVPPVGAPPSSPFIDNVDIPETPRSDDRPNHDAIFSGAGMRLVKIGQTSLHNPAGRSSWIGL